MIKKLSPVAGIILFSAALSAQQPPPIPLPEDDLPLAPLHGDMQPPPSPSGPSSSIRPKMNNDIAKVVPVKCVKPRGKFPWNLEKARLSDLVDQISRMTCRNFIIASGVKPAQEISIISRTPITVEQAWQAFQSTLEANDLSLFKTGDYYKIIKRADSPRQPIAVVDEKGVLPNDEGMVTYLYDLKHLTKDVGQSLVKGLISRVGDVIVVGETFLVITDGSSNIRRVMSILGKVDISGAGNRIHIVDLVHADAVQIKSKLDDIFSGGKDQSRPRNPYDDFGPPPRGGQNSYSLQKMIADERTNKLIVISSDRAFDKIKEMIDVLDVPSSGASSKGEIYVYHLKNGDSKKLASTLQTLLQGVKSNSSRAPGQFGKEEVFEGEIKISADEATNSLVIVASPRDYKAITRVIAKLDQRRAQVYMEAAILEVSLTDTKDINLGAFGGIPLPGDNTMIAATPGGKDLAQKAFGSIISTAGSTSQAQAAAGLQPFLSTLGFVGAGQKLKFNGGEVTVPGVGAILGLVQNYNNVDILSTPSLMTLNNEKAEMSVGQRIPTVSGISTAGLGGGSAAGLIPVQNITMQEPKLKIGITPHINEDNLIRMEIEQDISDLAGEVTVVAGQPPQPKFTTKTAKTTVSAKDQQTIVLGGLITDKVSLVESKVPWLGDIPLLGHLFKSTKKEKSKTNLMLVLTPYAVRDENDLRKIHERKMKEREEFGKMYFGDRISKFDPYVDYDKKKGPLTSLMDEVGKEMQKTENGGPGLPGEVLFKQPDHEDFERHKVQTLDESVQIGGASSENTTGPTPMEPTEITIVDQPPMPAPEPAPMAVGE